MKEFALVCWIAAIGFGAGIATDQQCFRSPAEQSAIDRANLSARECLRLKAELDAVRRAALSPELPPAGERIPAIHPPLPTH